MKIRPVTAIAAATLLLGCEQKPNVLPVYEHVVRAALPHDMKPSDPLACIGAHDKNGELYDLGCNVFMEQEPMVGIYKARFSENPTAGSLMQADWVAHGVVTSTRVTWCWFVFGLSPIELEYPHGNPPSARTRGVG